ncbi:MAG: hypothetical protein M5U34_18585 [Chloroflexi bacterium]|nr:hypothetical protein [Chloroflexota bacterium]
MPIVGQSADGDFYHILDLPAFGLLILIKNQEALAEPIIKSLTPLLTKLAAAAWAASTQPGCFKVNKQYKKG